ncbi:MAG: RimJ/RimL family protein N-acetyltransferase, partial [Pseudomonadales bacterium]
MGMQQFKQVVLEGDYVRLEPISVEHKQGLIEAVADGKLCELFVTMVPHKDAIDEFIDNAIAHYNNGQGLVLATIDKASNKVIGSTRFMDAKPVYKRVEIGFTFIAESYQRIKINTEAKLLMLTYGFEALALNRVQFLTDYSNQTSRNAILRIGAKQEGILKSHMQMTDGRIRDSVIFGITSAE